MSAIRLEKFTHIRNIGAQLVSNAEIEAVKSEAFEAGIREGAAAATEAFSSQQSRCLSQIQEAIEDSFFVREEASRQALSALYPLIRSLVDAITPALAQSGLSNEIAHIATEAAKLADKPAISVFVPEGMTSEVIGLLKPLIADIQVSDDAHLASTEARVAWSDGFDTINLDANTRAVEAAIQSYFSEIENPTKLEVNNGR